MTGTALKTTLILLTLSLLTGCKTLNLMQDKKEETLQDRLKAYQSTVRWGYPGQAYNFLRQDIAAKTPVPTNLNNVSVTDYKVIRLPDLVSENQAAQTAVIGFIFDDRQVEKTIQDQQLWEYDPEAETWFRINPIPEFH
ncbi:hypothetical protein [Sedimenticola selenatireducens]|uniref:Uncharacterized protein n=1 Tax=Sedimenticola selenatireducens TaxID=191960 RepID=A0A2N6CTR4_9GAMM|nr:hypothetical protein [Sedimenticola selenatireducens]PLX60556.1 MAG: hypothetical protein C0630_13950 [Sedimenticola selenatireducens]